MIESIFQVLKDTAHILVGLFTNIERPFWFGYLAIFLIFSFFFFLRRSGLGFRDSCREFTADLKKRYSNRSSAVDVKLFFANFLIYSIIVYFIYDYSVTAGHFRSYLQDTFSAHLADPRDPASAPGYLGMLGFAVGQVLVWDFVFYWWHRLLHTVPVLWQLHKLHHSAEVLTPLTRLRQDPYATVAYLLIFDCANSLYAVAFSAAFGIHASPLLLWGVPAGWFLIYVFQHHFTHSHLWISYGRLNYLFISPSQHQIHHSYLPEHINKNYGSTFAWMDWMFGTLYNTTEKQENLKLGIDGIEERKINSLPILGILAYPVTSWARRR